jgi:hypothetical protein
MSKKFLGTEKNKEVKTIRRNIIITEGMNKKAEEIARHQSLTTFTGVVENAIRVYWDDTVGKEIRYGKAKPADMSGMSGPEIARIKIQKKKDEEQAEKDLKDEEKTRMCEELLFGDVEVDGPYKYCKFKVHGKFDSKESKVPLFQAGPEVARSVFVPNMEAVFDARPDLPKELGFKYNKNVKKYERI